MKATVTWQGRMSFTGTADSGFEIALDSAASVGGDEQGFRPMELLAISLAGCTAMDVISILRKKRQEVTGFEVRVSARQAEEHPRVFTRIALEYLVTGRAVEEAAVTRSIELSALRYCPVQAMLAPSVPIEFNYSIYEANGEAAPTLVRRGSYTPAKESG